MSSSQYRSVVRKALAVCGAVADGTRPAHATGIGENGDGLEVLKALRRLIERCDAYVRESRASREYLPHNKCSCIVSARGTFAQAGAQISGSEPRSEKTGVPIQSIGCACPRCLPRTRSVR